MRRGRDAVVAAAAQHDARHAADLDLQRTGTRTSRGWRALWCVHRVMDGRGHHVRRAWPKQHSLCCGERALVVLLEVAGGAACWCVAEPHGAQLERERERERERESARPSPQQTSARAGAERGARGNCGDGHDVEGREKQEDERKRERRRLDLFWGTISLRSTFRHAVERCGQVSADLVRRRPRRGKRAAVRRAQGF